MLDPRKISNPSQPCSSQMVRQLLHPVEAYLSWNVCSRTSSISHSEPVTLAPTTTTPSAWPRPRQPPGRKSFTDGPPAPPPCRSLPLLECLLQDLHDHPQRTCQPWRQPPPPLQHGTPRQHRAQILHRWHRQLLQLLRLLQTQISRTFKIFTSHKFLNSISSRVILKKNWLV